MMQNKKLSKRLWTQVANKEKWFRIKTAWHKLFVVNSLAYDKKGEMIRDKGRGLDILDNLKLAISYQYT